MRTHSRTRMLAGLGIAALLAPVAVLAPAAAAPSEPRPAHHRVQRSVQAPARAITYTQWTTQRQLKQGRFVGTRAVRGTLRLNRPRHSLRYRDPHGKPTKKYAFGAWLSPWTRPGHVFDELIASWDATTPGDSWVRIQVRGLSESGKRSKWYALGNWAETDRRFHRTSLGPQADDLAQVSVDTLKTRYSMGFTAWQMRVSLLRRIGTRAQPTVDTVGAMVSRLPSADRVATSRPGVARGITVDLPGYSQMIHDGHYPEYDAGGEAWCSPTSVSMVLGGLDRLPTEQEYSWVPAGHPDPWVDHAARSQYDYGFQGAGNWSFSAAYAATHADAAFVTRLRNLREAERFIKFGIPLVASVQFGRGELDGAPISATPGHLMVIVGFTPTGDVVVNDPAAPDDGSVVRTYDRGQFENAWVPKSGGLVYVVRNLDQRLPPTRTKNW